MAEIAYADFAKLDIRIGHVTQAEPYPEARVPAGFELIQIDEFRSFHPGFATDLHEAGRFKERFCIRNRSPRREVDDLV